MRNIILKLLSLLIFINIPLLAGSGGRYFTEQPSPIPANIAIVKAKEIIVKLVDKKYIDKSWLLIDATRAIKKIFNDRPEWVVEFTNKNITDKSKQNLYVFLRLHGEYIAVNHTGL